MATQQEPNAAKRRALTAVSWISGILAAVGVIQVVVALASGGGPGPVVFGTVIFAAIFAGCRLWVKSIDAAGDRTFYQSLQSAEDGTQGDSREESP